MAGDDPTKLVQPQVKFSTSAGSTSDSGFFSAALNDLARVGCYIYPGDTSGVAEVPFKEIASILAASQSSARSSRLSFSASLATDADGGISFSGVEVSPTVQMGVANVGPMLNAVHATGRIHALDFSLYTMGGNPDLRSVTLTDIVKAIRDTLQITVRYWLKNVLPGMTPASAQKEAAALHADNTEPLQILDRILANSAAYKIPGLEEAAKAVPMIKTHFLNFLLDGFNSSQGEFWGGFLGMCQSLGLLYAPSFGDAEANGSLISVESSLQAAESRTDLSVIGWRGSPGLPEVPIARVMIPKVPMSNLGRSEQTRKLLPSQATRTSITYPEGDTKGRVLSLQVPPYLSPVFQSLAGSWSAAGRNVNGASVRENMSRMRAMAQAQQEAIHQFLRGYAQNMFKAMKLQGSQVGLQVPLSFDWEVGKSYQVGIRGVPVFKGLLASVNHAISSKGSGTAQTDLAFNHVLWGGNSF